MIDLPFGIRLKTLMEKRGPLCVGIDPHPQLMELWGLEHSVNGLEYFARTIVELLGPVAAALKPQSALFEVYGSAGISVLERTLRDCEDIGTISILDVKRGDIGSTMSAYAQAYLGQEAPMRADAMTLSPYLGYGSLHPALSLAKKENRGTFVLGFTSNLEGPQVQHARDENGQAVGTSIVNQAGNDNSYALKNGHWGHVGIVIGATIGDALRNTDTDLSKLNGPILAPGFGAQGAGSSEMRDVFGSALSQVLVSSSRGILQVGPGNNDIVSEFHRNLDAVDRVLSSNNHL
ncbi:MAG: orotidine-5'-phosphate decarboxylase [Actinomycetaceae bacterium]|nr:orotidine-5'-phosphate decarboxylase [Actinomycetaceae bacterium]